jgi:hypothetical protein
MSAWAFFVDTVGLSVTILLMLVLRWAAIERSRLHRDWARWQRHLGWKVSQSVDWCMAIAAAAGCA